MTRNFEQEKNDFIEFLNDLQQYECITELEYEKDIKQYSFKVKHYNLLTNISFQIDKDGFWLKFETKIRYNYLENSFYLFNEKINEMETNYKKLFKIEILNHKSLINQLLKTYE